MNSVKNSEKNPQYIFGPVPSRRLGRSLGIDLVPFKTCSYDCVYCQLGRTTKKTVERKEWVPLKTVIEQLKEHLSCEPDYITLSGSGEPILYSKLGQLISEIKKITDIPVAVLTNGSLLWQREVRSSLECADLAVPSLDAGSSNVFGHVNRPHKEITFDKMISGLIKFSEEFQGKYWLEVFILAGITTIDAEVNRLRDYIAQIQPDLVQVNTVTRPPAESYAEPVPKKQLEQITASLYDKAEVIADYQDVHHQKDFTITRDDILTLLQRRPCTIEDIASGLGLHRNEVVKYVEELSNEGKIQASPQSQKLYYKAVV